MGVIGLLLAAACAAAPPPGQNASDRDRTSRQAAPVGPGDPAPPGGPPGYSTAFPPAIY
jgi:hypothetical protein